MHTVKCHDLYYIFSIKQVHRNVYIYIYIYIYINFNGMSTCLGLFMPYSHFLPSYLFFGTHLYIKYSYQIQIICTQLYGFK